MANPQLENGFTKIANEIIEELIKLPLTGSEIKMVLYVIRKTYGFHKKEDKVSISEFQKKCKLSRQTVCNGLKRLVKGNILGVVKGDRLHSSIYGIQKNYEFWLVKDTRLVKETTQNLVKSTIIASQIHQTVKRKYKRNILKEREFEINIDENPIAVEPGPKHIVEALDSLRKDMPWLGKDVTGVK